ncbi:MAG: hypothetical protein LBH59_09485 [Planctomycetaceae bacterium]|jgi:hypothetical protein|nr:hypothetical protein [Planctomycetaceae bacterium]
MRLLTLLSFLCIFSLVFLANTCVGQSSLYPRRPQFQAFDPTGEFDFHAGIHSGSWTLKRQQILEAESKDPHRSCYDPYCQRCSKHLADYGHEYQYIHGVSQAQFWYRNTWKNIAPASKLGYDEHSYPYLKRGFPAATMSWEYQQVLNHAIWEQLQARNAASVADAAKNRADTLRQLHDDSANRLANSKAAWDYQVENGICIAALQDSVNVVEISPCMKNMGFKKSGNQYLINPCDNACELISSCEYCLAQAKYIKDSTYLREVCIVLEQADKEAAITADIAKKWADIAKLSKADADVATRFKKVHHKPPRYKEVLAAEGKNVEDLLQNKKNDNETTNTTPTPTTPIDETAEK